MEAELSDKMEGCRAHRPVSRVVGSRPLGIGRRELGRLHRVRMRLFGTGITSCGRWYCTGRRGVGLRVLPWVWSCG